MSARVAYSVHHPPRRVSGLDIPQWLPIATQRSGRGIRWILHDDAPVSLADARRMVEQGTLLMAQRREGAKIVVVVKTPNPG